MIVVYSRSKIIETLLTSAHENLSAKNESFELIVVDDPPEGRGRELIRRLSLKGIKCVYTTLNGVPYFMNRVTKIFIHATSMLANGNCIARVGSAMLGCIAKSYRIPFIVLCESYKFSERSQLDQLSKNECIKSQANIIKKDDHCVEDDGQSI